MGIDIYFNGMVGMPEGSTETVDGYKVTYQQVRLCHVRKFNALADWIASNLGDDAQNFEMAADDIERVIEALDDKEEIERDDDPETAAYIEGIKAELRAAIEWLGKGDTYRFVEYSVSY